MTFLDSLLLERLLPSLPPTPLPPQHNPSTRPLWEPLSSSLEFLEPTEDRMAKILQQRENESLYASLFCFCLILHIFLTRLQRGP